MLDVSIIAANTVAWALVLGVEVARRRRQEVIAIPFAFLLMVLAVQLVPLNQTTAFLSAMPLILLIAIREALFFVQTNRSEISLAGTVGTGLAALGILTWWLVAAINNQFALSL